MKLQSIPEVKKYQVLKSPNAADIEHLKDLQYYLRCIYLILVFLQTSFKNHILFIKSILRKFDTKTEKNRF